MNPCQSESAVEGRMHFEREWLLISSNSQHLGAWTTGAGLSWEKRPQPHHCGTGPALPASTSASLHLEGDVTFGLKGSEVKRRGEHLGAEVPVVTS